MMKLSDRAWRELGIAPPYLTECSESDKPDASPTQQFVAVSLTDKLARPATRSAESLAKIAHLAWEQLPAAVEACSACVLNQGRKQSVPGRGDHPARWLFVGEAPGSEEDQQGEPFQGAAGILLDSMLSSLNLSRQKEVYITNVIKCRPPDQRTPEITECHACMPFLERQIALLQPKIIVALGRVAAHSLLNSETNLGSLRNKVHAYRNIPVVVTFHPAYLLRNLPEKAKAWADLCLAKKTLDQA
jgi:DNA polymerase